MRQLIVIMGASGCGKSTLARTLADARGAQFVEADDYHTRENVACMRAGIPLTDADRVQWLDALTAAIADAEAQCVVTACSALTPYVQERLTRDCERDVRFVLLELSADKLAKRLKARQGHFMNPKLLDSQLAALCTPPCALRVDADATPEAVLERVRAMLGE